MACPLCQHASPTTQLKGPASDVKAGAIAPGETVKD